MQGDDTIAAELARLTGLAQPTCNDGLQVQPPSAVKDSKTADIDTSSEAVERARAAYARWDNIAPDQEPEAASDYIKALEAHVRALAAERDDERHGRIVAARLAAGTADRMGETRAERDAAIADREKLLEVARAARHVGVFDKATIRLAAALDALPPGMLDHS